MGFTPEQRLRSIVKPAESSLFSKFSSNRVLRLVDDGPGISVGVAGRDWDSDLV